MSAPRKQLRHRIPVRLRQYWKLVTGSVAFVVVLAGVFGTGMIRPYTTSSADAAPPVVTQDIAGTKESSAQLNEALAISLVDASGEPAQRYTYSGFTVNDRVSTPRLIVEYLDEGYAENLGNGVLYKSLASGQFTYQGGDQTEYTDDFKQINNIGGTDLQPVISLIKWVEQSSAEEFANGLADRLDVESFARYIALQKIVMNFDDMAGPGKNYRNSRSR
jgi:spore coat protein CotH